MKIERMAWVTSVQVVDNVADLKVGPTTTVGELQRAIDASGYWMDVEVAGFGSLRFRIDSTEALAIAERMKESPATLKATLTIEG